jgi:hypothetical protein
LNLKLGLKLGYGGDTVFNMEDMLPLMDVDSQVLALTGSRHYREWINSPYRKAIAAKDELMPSEVLKEMLKTKIPSLAGAEISIMEAIIGQLIEKALKGEDKAIEKIYNEMQHAGVQKIENTHVIKLPEVAMEVFERAGLLNSPVIDLEVEEVDPLLELELSLAEVDKV